MYLVGKDADGEGAVRPETSAGADGNGNGNGGHATLGHVPHVEEIRAEAARRAATDLATAALNASDTETAAHSDDVDVIADGLCRLFGITGRERENIMVAARLHDLGKVAIPPEVLEKPGPLNDAEWAIMRRHTIVGQQILDAVPEMEEVATIVRHSHERWDGEGYPDGLADEEIPLGSRIVACADAYHAVRSDRAYRPGRSADAALAEICSCAGTQFDPDVTDALELLAEEMRAQAPSLSSANGHQTSYRSTRLAALLLILALGVGGSAIARFAGSPFTPEAEASDPPVPSAASPFALPDLSDLPIFDLGLLDRGRPGDFAGGRGGPDGTPSEGSGAPPGAPGRGADRPGSDDHVSSQPGPSSASPDRPDNPAASGATSEGGNQSGPSGGGGVAPPADSGSGGSGGNSGGDDGGNSGNAPDPPSSPPGQTPGGNPGHGGLPPGNPVAPGHQPAGTPGHGGAVPSPAGGGTPPGQVQQSAERPIPDVAAEPPGPRAE